jgi:hypothetical protein
MIQLYAIPINLCVSLVCVILTKRLGLNVRAVPLLLKHISHAQRQFVLSAGLTVNQLNAELVCREENEIGTGGLHMSYTDSLRRSLLFTGLSFFLFIHLRTQLSGL